MSPEQASGERQVDARSDVYALGSVLFEMLAGQPPFTGATAQAVIAKRFQSEAPGVRTIRPSVPVEIEQAISRALASVAADRFATAVEFAKALGAGTTTRTAAARPSGAATSKAQAASSSAPVARPQRQMPTGLALLVIGFLIGVGVLFAWKRGGHTTGGSGPRVIAVLPFDNQGDSTQEYFADGITDEVRGKLSALPALQVIAGASSKTYRHTDKPLAQVASELGADYLLMAKVRWAKNPDGTTQVRVSPELIAITGASPPPNGSRHSTDHSQTFFRCRRISRGRWRRPSMWRSPTASPRNWPRGPRRISPPTTRSCVVSRSSSPRARLIP